ncbi:MAG: hypothetical protein HY777_02910 [Betaproteobacteria bacterium]|nr:hypothetical protein [Betaproteobacteria bacterium]
MPTLQHDAISPEKQESQWLAVRYFSPWRPGFPARVDQLVLGADGSGERATLLGAQVRSVTRIAHGIPRDRLVPGWLFALPDSFDAPAAPGIVVDGSLKRCHIAAADGRRRKLIAGDCDRLPPGLAEWLAALDGEIAKPPAGSPADEAQRWLMAVPLRDRSEIGGAAAQPLTGDANPQARALRDAAGQPYRLLPLRDLPAGWNPPRFVENDAAVLHLTTYSSPPGKR